VAGGHETISFDALRRLIVRDARLAHASHASVRRMRAVDRTPHSGAKDLVANRSVRPASLHERR
jgi:hypothetical protein